MFKKTTSRKGNKVNLFHEIQKEYAVYFNPIIKSTKDFLLRHPYQLFGVMMVCIIVSVGLNSTLSKQKKTSPVVNEIKQPYRPSVGLNQILSNAATLNELNNRVTKILSKDSLTRSDSVQIDSAFRQIKSINLH